MNNIRVVVMGTTDFAVPALKKLYDSDFDVVCVVCQPDRPNGRGKKNAPAANEENGTGS